MAMIKVSHSTGLASNNSGQITLYKKANNHRTLVNEFQHSIQTSLWEEIDTSQNYTI